MSIKISNVTGCVSVSCGDLPNGTVVIYNGTAYILGKELKAHEGCDLPSALRDCRQRTALTGDYAGSQSVISKSAVVRVADFTMTVVNDINGKTGE